MFRGIFSAIGTFASAWMWYIIGALCLVIGAQWTVHKITMGLIRAELKSTQEQVGQLTTLSAARQVQINSLLAGLKTQNKAVEDLVAAGVARTDAAMQAIAREKANTAKWKGKYTDILTAPKPSEDDCKALGITLDRYIEVRQQEEATL